MRMRRIGSSAAIIAVAQAVSMSCAGLAAAAEEGESDAAADLRRGLITEVVVTARRS
jgi:hypothetical protein